MENPDYAKLYPGYLLRSFLQIFLIVKMQADQTKFVLAYLSSYAFLVLLSVRSIYGLTGDFDLGLFSQNLKIITMISVIPALVVGLIIKPKKKLFVIILGGIIGFISALSYVYINLYSGMG